MNIDLNVVLPLVVSIITIIGGYLKIRSYHDKAIEHKCREIQDYTDKEISHLREITFNEVKSLEKKIDQLRDELQQNQTQLINLLTSRK